MPPADLSGRGHKKLKAKVKVFQIKVKGNGQGHVLKIYGTIGKVLSEETHMLNTKYESPIA